MKLLCRKVKKLQDPIRQDTMMLSDGALVHVEARPDSAAATVSLFTY